MISFAATTLLTCSLIGFDGFPKEIKGKPTMITKKWVVMEIFTKNTKEKMEITINKKRCK